MSKTHIRDIRMYNNAGMLFPVCGAGETLLDTNKCSVQFAAKREDATCQRCQKLFPKRYPWATQVREVKA